MMSQLWILLMVLAVAISATPQMSSNESWQDHLSARKERASSDIFPASPSNISSGSSSFRFKRSSNVDAFISLEFRISTLARVVTGVSLYNGLVVGSIPVDMAIAELMNVGSISLQDLNTFDKTEVDDFVASLMDASGKISDQSSVIEQIIIEIQEMKSLWSKLEDLGTLPNKTEFENLVVLSTIELADLDKLSMEDTEKALKKNTVVEIENIKTNLNLAITACKTAKAALDQKDVLNTLGKMTPYHQFAELLEFHKPTSIDVINYQGDDKIAAMKDDFRHLESIAKGDVSLFVTVDAIVSSRSFTAPINREYTSGFVNGYKDLKDLAADSEISSIKKLNPWVDVKDGLISLSNLVDSMSKLDQSWNAPNVLSSKRSLKKALQLETSLRTIKDVSSTVDALVKSYQLCKYTPPVPKTIDPIVRMSRNLRRAFKKVEAFNSIVRIHGENADVIKSMDSSKPDSVASASNLFKKLKLHLQVLKSGPDLKAITAEITRDDGYFTTISTDHQRYNTMMKCLNEKEDLTDVALASALAVQTRDLKDDKNFASDIDEAIQIVYDSAGTLNDIRESMESIKNSPLDQSKRMLQLKELGPYSKPLGDSAAVIDKIQKLLENKAQLIDFITNGHVVDQMADSRKLSIKDSEMVETHWFRFEDVSEKIIKLLNGAQNRKDSVVKPVDFKLEAYGPIVQGLDGLGDVDLDAERRIIAVDKIEKIATDQAVKDQLALLKKPLKSLSSLDMTLARHSLSLSRMNETLTGISDVFAKTAPPTTPEPVIVMTAPSRAPEFETRPAREPKGAWGEFEVGTAVCIALVVTMLLLDIGVRYYLNRN